MTLNYTEIINWCSLDEEIWFGTGSLIGKEELVSDQTKLINQDVY